MIRRKFYLAVVVRILIMVAASLAFAFSIHQYERAFTTLGAALVMAGTGYDLVRITNRFNRNMASFFEALKHEDHGFGVSKAFSVPGYPVLSGYMNELSRQFSELHATNQIQVQFMNSLLEHVPVGVVAVEKNGKVLVFNRPAQKLLHIHRIAHWDALREKYPALHGLSNRLKPGDRRMIKLTVDQQLKHLSLEAGFFASPEKQVRIYSIQDVGREVSEAEMKTWQQLIRVLTHEINNSISPIYSLSDALQKQLNNKLSQPGGSTSRAAKNGRPGDTPGASGSYTWGSRSMLQAEADGLAESGESDQSTESYESGGSAESDGSAEAGKLAESGESAKSTETGETGAFGRFDETGETGAFGRFDETGETGAFGESDDTRESDPSGEKPDPATRFLRDRMIGGLEVIRSRSEGLLGFVEKFRSLTPKGSLHPETFRVSDLFYRVRILMGEELANAGKTGSADRSGSTRDPSGSTRDRSGSSSNESGHSSNGSECPANASGISPTGAGSSSDQYGEDPDPFSRSLPGKEIILTYSVYPESLQLYADQRLVEQILINLVKNARQALEEMEGPDKGRITMKAFKEQDHILLQVSDNGPGIPAEEQDQVFVPFYTTRRQGSGIGLSLSRQIMRMHTGSISLHSQPDQGSTFILKF